MGYTLLEIEKELPEVLKNRPRWVTCVGFATAILMFISSAIMIGVVIGYTYCYIEYKTGLRAGKSQSTNLQFVHMPYPESEEKTGNRTINGALASSMLVSRILTIGHGLVEEELSIVPSPIDEANMLKQFS